MSKIEEILTELAQRSEANNPVDLKFREIVITQAKKEILGEVGKELFEKALITYGSEFLFIDDVYAVLKEMEGEE